MSWRRDAPEPADESVRRLVDDAMAAVRDASARMAVLEARVDQVRTFFREQAKAHRNNRMLVNVLLDADNMLHGPYPEIREGGG